MSADRRLVVYFLLWPEAPTMYTFEPVRILKASDFMKMLLAEVKVPKK